MTTATTTNGASISNSTMTTYMPYTSAFVSRVTFSVTCDGNYMAFLVNDGDVSGTFRGATKSITVTPSSNVMKVQITDRADNGYTNVRGYWSTTSINLFNGTVLS